MSKIVTPLLILLFLLVPVRVKAQDPVSYAIQSESKLWIDGTSNKSDWTVHATEMSGYVLKNPEGTTAEPGIEETRFEVPAIKLVSRKSSIMDRLMRKALNVQQHPDIVYALTAAEVSSSTEDSFTLDTKGDLSLAGVTKEIEMPVTGEQLSNGQIRFTGSYTMLMSDFDMAAPTAMYGALRTGNEVTVHFDVFVAQDAAQE